MAERRSYHQFCGLAAALDVLGERWTLLIVRELLLGPRRFTDLADNLTGAGPNLLTERLHTLMACGVVGRSHHEADGRSRVYELTEVGEQLREPVLALARWGLRHADVDAGGEVRPGWGLLAVEAMMKDAPPSPVDESYTFNIDDEQFHIVITGGVPSVARGPARAPSLTVTTDAHTFVQIGAEILTPLHAVLSGQLKIVGENDAIARCSALLGLDG